MLQQTLKVRFYVRVRKARSGCWLWVGYKNRSGYGQFCFRGKTYKAHRLAWLLQHNNIPTGLVVRHKCKNKLCVRLTHLRLGTSAENRQDESGLTKDTIKRLRGYYRREVTRVVNRMMYKFPHSRAHLHRILQGIVWRDIEYSPLPRLIHR